jgi:hypothetical protein
MKKIIFLAAAVAGMFAVASCQKESVPGVIDGEKVTATFTVALPQTATKSISDGLSADIVYWAAFDEKGGALEGMNGTAVVDHRNASFDVTLVKHYTYKFVFWAQDSKCTAYTFDPETGKVTVSYEGAANDDSRDAFYRQADVKIVAAGEVQTIELYRPFAQINFLAADYKAVEAVGLHNGMTSTVNISGLPTVLNGLNGTVAEFTGVTDLAATAVPTDPATYTINGQECGWYSMNYVLAAGKDNFTSPVTGVFNHDKKKDIQIPVANVPYERNHRTNIIGNFFTDEVKINLVVIEKFEEPDHIVEAGRLVEASTADEINAALEAGLDVVLADDVNEYGLGNGETAVSQTNGGTIDGNGNSLTVTGGRNSTYYALTTNGGTIKNLTIDSGSRGISVTGGENSSKVYLEKVYVDGSRYAIYSNDASGQGLEAKECTFDGMINYDDAIGNVTFTDCSFSGISNNYYNPNPNFTTIGAPTTFTECDFAEGYKIHPSANVVFENCKYANSPLTAANVRYLLTQRNDDRYVTVK